MSLPIVTAAGPCLLVATPQLQQANFTQTTILLSEFNQQGAMGFVLNKPLGVSVAQLLENAIPEYQETLSNLSAFWGGPVQNDLGFVIHQDPSLAKDSIRISEDLFMSGTSETLLAFLRKNKDDQMSPFRLFLGYAGWGPRQLEVELAENSWIVSPIHKSLIFDTPHEDVWKKSYELLGVDPHKIATSSQNLIN